MTSFHRPRPRESLPITVMRTSDAAPPREKRTSVPVPKNSGAPPPEVPRARLTLRGVMAAFWVLRRTVLGVTAGVVAVTAIVAIPLLVWRARPVRTLGVVVLDKTVPFRNYREHETFTWLLHALKVAAPGGGYLDPTRDYVGYDPTTRRGRILTDAHLRAASLLFIADTYGVYADDYAHPGEVAHMERSSVLFGGIEESEARVVEAFTARGGTVVAEFNTFGSPTLEPARTVMEGVFGVRWTHWVGRYWTDLQSRSEVPRWVGQVYTRIYHRPFDFRGAGFVFVREDEDMVVLQPGVHLGPDVMTITRTQQAPDLTGLPAQGAYRYWLDVVTPTQCDVVYEYHLDLTAEGARLLVAHGIPRSFPALVRRRQGPRAWYFAGDFVDSSAPRGNPERAGILTWRSITASSHSDPDAAFLWNWYAPILERIVAGVR